MYTDILTYLVAALTLGLLAKIIQCLVTYRVKYNVYLDRFHLLIESALFVVGVIYLLEVRSVPQDAKLLTNTCSPYMDFSVYSIEQYNQILNLEFYYKVSIVQFKLLISILMVLVTILQILILERTEFMGQLILMCKYMIEELAKFFATFGLFILITIYAGFILNSILKLEVGTNFEIVLDLFNALNGIGDYSEFTSPIGQAYFAGFMYYSRVLLISLLAAIFINRYKIIY